MEFTINFLAIFVSIICGLIVTAQGITFEEDVTLSSEQKQALDKFKTDMETKLPHKYMAEEFYLIKWLKDSNFDVERAESRLIINLEWRRDNKMDTIISEDFSDCKREFPYYIDGRDKYGKPILLLEVGGLDLRKALIQGRIKRLSRYANRAIEEGCNLVRELGEKYKNITRGHLIINLDGFSVIQHSCLPCIPFLLRIAIQYQEHYPECVDQIIFVNTPSTVEPLVAIAKQVLTQKLKDSLKFYGTNKKQWIEGMSKDFDFDKLPPSLGGSQIYPGMEEDFNF